MAKLTTTAICEKRGRLFAICEKRGRSAEAGPYNALVISWPQIAELAVSAGKNEPDQIELF